MLGANNDHQYEPTAQNALNTRGCQFSLEKTIEDVSHVTCNQVKVIITKLVAVLNVE